MTNLHSRVAKTSVSKWLTTPHYKLQEAKNRLNKEYKILLDKTAKKLRIKSAEQVQKHSTTPSFT